MDRNAVLVKTGKGAEEVKSRTFGLAARLRSVLIMVDGNSTVEDYVTRFGAIPDIEGSLQQLLDQGFVEARASTAAAPPVAAQTATLLRAQRLRRKGLARRQSPCPRRRRKRSLNSVAS